VRVGDVAGGRRHAVSGELSIAGEDGNETRVASGHVELEPS